MNTYAVELENIKVKRPTPVVPYATVNCPKEPAVVAAASDLMPFVATATVTVPDEEDAVLSMIRSKTVPASAPNAAPNNVPVGSVMVTAEVEVH